MQRWPLLPGLLLAALFLHMTANGFGGTSDSVHYLWAANAFRESGKLLAPDGTPYRFWGPLYPVLLSVFFGNNGVRMLHGAALIMHLVLWSRIGRWLSLPGRANVLPWLLALSAAVLTPAKYIWSEAVFGALAAAYCYGLLAWTRNWRTTYLLVATAAGFLLPLQRTSGFFLLAGAGAGMLFTGLWRGRWWSLVGHWLCCAAGGLLWNYYAEVVAGPPVYQALRGWSALGSSMADYGFVLMRWFIPLGSSWREAVPGLWVFALLALFWLLWPRKHVIGTATLDGSAAALGEGEVRLLWWVLAVTVGALLFATAVTRAAAGTHDAERYIAVLAGPVLILTLAGWPRATAHRVMTDWQWRVTGRVLLAALLVYSAARVARNAHAQRQRTPVIWPVQVVPPTAGSIEKGKAGNTAFPLTQQTE